MGELDTSAYQLLRTFDFKEEGSCERIRKLANILKI